MNDADYKEAGLSIVNSFRGGSSTSGGYRFTYQNLSCIYTHPKTGAKVFIGNLSAANTKSELDDHNITRIVNCQEPESRNFFENDSKFQYFRYNIASCHAHTFNDFQKDASNEALIFFLDYFEWVDKNMEEGKSVLVHCLAGAHRAGTAGIGYYMWRKSHENGGTKVDHTQCISEVKEIRPIVNPIGQFTPLLAKLERGINKKMGLLSWTE